MLFLSFAFYFYWKIQEFAIEQCFLGNLSWSLLFPIFIINNICSNEAYIGRER